MASLGRVGEFCEKKEDWATYLNRLESFFTANGIADADEKRAVLLRTMGCYALKMVKGLVAPKTVGEESYDDLVMIMKNYLEVKPTEIAHRLRFYNRTRRPLESVALFHEELCRLADRCTFGDVRDDMLRDRLVCGINNHAIQLRLLAEDNLTYVRVLQIAIAMELLPAADADSGPQQETTPETLETPDTSVALDDDVNPKQQRPNYVRRHKVCWRCGKINHQPKRCRFKDTKCHACGQCGHLSRVCTNPKKEKNVECIEEVAPGGLDRGVTELSFL